MTPLQIALAALSRIASLDEGETVDSTFDEPKSASTARKAIKDIVAWQPLPDDVLLDVARKGLARHHGRAESDGRAIYLAIGREFEATFTRRNP